MNPRLPTRHLAQAAVYLYGAYKFSLLGVDMDLWGHLRFGEAIWTHGALEWTDPYSYTAFGHEWINHEWLSEVLFYVVFAAFGSQGLMALKVIFGLIVLHLLSRIYFDRQDHLFVYLVVFYLLIHTMLVGFRPRPHLFTWLFMALLLWMLYRALEKNERALYASPVLFLLWVNTHGGVTAGFAVFGVAVLFDALQRRFEGQAQRKDIWLCLALSGLMLLANPYGIRLWQFLLETVPKQRDVLEWSSVPLFYPIFLPLKILTLMFVTTVFFKHPRRWWPLALILFGIYFGYQHLRHAVLTGMLMASYTAVEWSRFLRERGRLEAPAAGPGRWLPAGILAATVLALTGMLIQKGLNTGYRIQVNDRFYPVAAVRFLKENHIGGNILLPFAWGEYVIWHLRGSRVSIDGRYWTVYPDQVLQDIKRFHQGDAGWQAVLSRYPHEIILTDYRNRELDTAAGWIRVYQDPVARVYLKQGFHLKAPLRWNPAPSRETDPDKFL